MSRQTFSVLLIVLILAVVALTLSACTGQTPEPETNAVGDATEIEMVFDEQFPEDETTTFSDDFDTLDDDLALS